MSAPPRPRKRFGQNFLIHEGAIQRITEKVKELAGGAVVEIGPGRGALTARLLESGLQVAAIEIDHDLADILEDRFRGDSFRLFRSDVLKFPFEEALDREQIFLAGNLPYNISKPIANRMVAERHLVSGAVFMFQKEVAERLVASPDSRAYGPLAIYTGSAYSIQKWFDLSPGAFRPQPAVTSSVTVWKPLASHILTEEQDQRLRRCLAVCFHSRRRTLFNNLRHGLDGGAEAAHQLLEITEIDGAVRADTLPPECFHRISESWPDLLQPL
jgi:16S rRNA (adenine1518-N6/adenine1519-N6)-dimethyltransferase